MIAQQGQEYLIDGWIVLARDKEDEVTAPPFELGYLAWQLGIFHQLEELISGLSL